MCIEELPSDLNYGDMIPTGVNAEGCVLQYDKVYSSLDSNKKTIMWNIKYHTLHNYVSENGQLPSTAENNLLMKSCMKWYRAQKNIFRNNTAESKNASIKRSIFENLTKN